MLRQVRCCVKEGAGKVAGTYHYDLGFGSEYEKFILGNIVKELIHELDLNSVCEYPMNNLMGDNSEIFSGYGLRVDRLSRLEQAKKGKYDLVWNFCEIEQQISLFKIIDEMLMLTGRYLLIILQNRRNPGVYLHKIYHTLTGRKWNHGNIMLMSTNPIVNLLSNYGRITRTGFFDIPWFVLDIYESGAFLRRLIPSRVAGSMLKIRKSRFEDLPQFCKKYFAHHSYVLFEKCSTADRK
jgi:hypothetical protein